MLITGVSTRVVDAGDRDWVFVRVDTVDADVFGWGEIVDEAFTTQEGWAAPPTKPGIGVELVEEVAAAHVGRSPRPHPEFAPDGSLLDW